MIYFSDAGLLVRSMVKSDAGEFADGFAAQNWHKPYELFCRYYVQQKKRERLVIVAETDGDAAGYATLLPHPNAGPFADKEIPEIVDFNVLIKYQRRGIGGRIMDVAETLAKSKSDCVSLSVGLHYGYGTAQRMYVKRGYIPDGTGVWYRGRQLEQYAECINDDDLMIYLLKTFND